VPWAAVPVPATTPADQFARLPDVGSQRGMASPTNTAAPLAELRICLRLGVRPMTLVAVHVQDLVAGDLLGTVSLESIAAGRARRWWRKMVCLYAREMVAVSPPGMGNPTSTAASLAGQLMVAILGWCLALRSTQLNLQTSRANLMISGRPQAVHLQSKAYGLWRTLSSCSGTRTIVPPLGMCP